MPIKRKVAKRAEHPITPEALAAYRAGDSWGLHQALKLKPWHTSPLDLPSVRPPWMAEGDWELASELLAELAEADNAG
jgi:hypothetical protein